MWILGLKGLNHLVKIMHSPTRKYCSVAFIVTTEEDSMILARIHEAWLLRHVVAFLYSMTL